VPRVNRFGATEEWRAIAKGSDPLYSIASVPGKEDGAWTEEDFYAHGAADWAGFCRQWDQYWPERAGTCLEIGCGAGRITRPLAGSFEKVIAVDVSTDMIARARAVVPNNVEFRHADGASLPVDDDAVDAVFCVHVMQHLEDFDAVLGYLREVRRVLRPGGSMMIHIDLHVEAPPSRRAQLREEFRLWRSRRGLRRGKEHSSMRMRRYWLSDVYWAIHGLGFSEIEMRMITPTEFGHLFWFARA
jgi:SAM-dependent methyltransferase